MDRYWHVPGEPKAVMAWIESHPPTGSHLLGEGSSVIGGVTKWFSAFQFAVSKEPGANQSEELSFETIAAQAGGAALRADAQVVAASAECATR
jgi:hypothetical protein